MEGSNRAAPVDIENPNDIRIPLGTSLRKELDSFSLSPLSFPCRIYKVPHRLRCVNEKAYTPQVVSIGPLHHGKKALEAMEEHKKRYLQHFLSRTDVSLEKYINKIRGKEASLRSCYPETIEFSSDQFVRIILVDAAFIIEFLLRSRGLIVSENEDDRIFNKPRMFRDLWPDMLLLENQLPFFILEDILDLAKTSLSSSYVTRSAHRLSITDLSVKLSIYSMFLLPGADAAINVDRISSSYEAEHFLDHIRLLCQPPMTSKVVGPGRFMPSITELYRAGVKFKVGSNENRFYIQFHTDGTLEIPKIAIADETEIVFRNLLAFEQCHCIDQCCYVSDYINVMAQFVHSPKDVDLLVEYEIIENGIGDSSEVSTLFYKLGIGIHPSANFTFGDLSEKLIKYRSFTWHRMKANLKQNHCNTPWATLSVIAAVVLLILTLIQTVCSIISAASA